MESFDKERKTIIQDMVVENVMTNDSLQIKLFQ